MTDHILCDVYRHMSPAIVHGDRVSDHLRENGARSRPGTNDLTPTGIVELLDLC
jgi:hypothetical protein